VTLARWAGAAVPLIFLIAVIALCLRLAYEHRKNR